MPRNLQFAVSDGILHVKITGEREPIDSDGMEEAVRCWITISDLRKRHGVKRVLVDDQLTGGPSTARSYAVATSVEGLGPAYDVRCAIVVRDARIRQHVDFGTKVANSRGALSAVFESPDAAEQWLRSA